MARGRPAALPHAPVARRYPRRCRFPHPEVAIRLPPVVAAAALLAAAGLASGFSEPRLDRITAPLADAVTARIAELSAIDPLSKAQKAELKKLNALSKRLAKRSSRLGQDIAELASGASGVAGLGEAGAIFADEVAEGVRRAGIEMNEREDMVEERRALLTKQSEQAQVDKLSAAAAKKRAAVNAAVTDRDRARLLAPAEVALTKALVLAEKLAKRTGKDLPAARLRSGDLVGPPGGRVVVPRGTGTSVDGCSIYFPPSSFVSATAVTVSEGTSFVADRNVPAGGAFVVGPAGLAFNGEAEISLVYTLPADADPADLAAFLDAGGSAQAIAGGTLVAGNRITASVTGPGSFQAGILAPPLGAPDGRYIVHQITASAVLGTSTTGFDPGLGSGLISSELTFRRDGSGSSGLGSSGVLGRRYTRAAPHHLDAGTNTVVSGYEFLWTPESAGRFTFDLPLGGTDSATAQGVVSTDGNILVLTGHGPGFDFFGVGLRAATGVTTADLAGRWTGVQLGTRLLDDAVEPYRTQWTAAARTFDAATDGTLTFDAAGSALTNTITYRTETADPVHVLALGAAQDGGSLVLTVQNDGSIFDFAGKLRGLYSPSAGILVVSQFEKDLHSTALMIAARQPASVPATAFEGTWNFAQFGIGATTGVPDSRSSAQDVTSRRGTLTVAAGSLDASETLTAGARGLYTLNGSPPITGMTWALSMSLPLVTTANSSFTIQPDASGTWRPAGGARWYGVSGDGSVLLGFLPGTDSSATLGMSVGVR